MMKMTVDGEHEAVMKPISVEEAGLSAEGSLRYRFDEQTMRLQDGRCLLNGVEDEIGSLEMPLPR